MDMEIVQLTEPYDAGVDCDDSNADIFPQPSNSVMGLTTTVMMLLMKSHLPMRHLLQPHHLSLSIQRDILVPALSSIKHLRLLPMVLMWNLIP